MEIANNLLFESVRRLLTEGHTVTLRVKGQSMRPFLKGGRDKVVLAPLHKVKRGDMVLAEISRGQFVLHRVIKIADGQLTLMGDANLMGTERCELSDVIGVVQLVIRNQKKIATRKWRFYAQLWMALKPIRRYLLLFIDRENETEKRI